MHKTKLQLILFVIVVWLFSSFLYMNGDWHGFGVDSSGSVYIGTDNYVGKEAVINVYRNGEYVRSVPVPPNRTYSFTVQDDDTILVSISGNVYVLDLSGAVISHQADSRNSLLIDLERNKEVINANGEHFFYRSILGYRTILSEDGDVLWRMPLGDYLSHLAASLFMSAFILFTSVATASESKHRKKNGRSHC